MAAPALDPKTNGAGLSALAAMLGDLGSGDMAVPSYAQSLELAGWEVESLKPNRDGVEARWYEKANCCLARRFRSDRLGGAERGWLANLAIWTQSPDLLSNCVSLTCRHMCSVSP